MFDYCSEVNKAIHNKMMQLYRENEDFQEDVYQCLCAGYNRGRDDLVRVLEDYLKQDIVDNLMTYDKSERARRVEENQDYLEYVAYEQGYDSLEDFKNSFFKFDDYLADKEMLIFAFEDEVYNIVDNEWKTLKQEFLNNSPLSKNIGGRLLYPESLHSRRYHRSI